MLFIGFLKHYFFTLKKKKMRAAWSKNYYPTQKSPIQNYQQYVGWAFISKIKQKSKSDEGYFFHGVYKHRTPRKTIGALIMCKWFKISVRLLQALLIPSIEASWGSKPQSSLDSDVQ